MPFVGMDVEAVEGVGRSLQAQAQELEQLVARIDSLVGRLPGLWEGRDSTTFVSQWWPQHRAELRSAGQAVHGLGDSALANVHEQRSASAGSGSGASSVTSQPAVSPTAAPGPQTGGAAGPVAAAAAGGSAVIGTWMAGAVGRGIDADGAYGNQCVDVVNDYARTLFPGVSSAVSVGGGDAKDLFAHASTAYFDKLGAGSTPQPGDVICIGSNPYSSLGHVAVVESVQNGAVHVIQQNGANPTGVTYRGVVSATEMRAVQGFLRPKV